MIDEIGVNVITEQRFLVHNGVFYADAVGGRDFWQRYLDVFAWVNIVSRVKQVEEIPESAVPVTDSRIKFAVLPNYYGPREMLSNFSNLWSRTKYIAADDGAFILRIPGMVGSFFYWHLQSIKWPYAVEVVGDPYDSLSYQAIGKSWARVMRPLAVLLMKEQCKNASAASYVTARALQDRYPTKAQYATHFSDVQLPNLFTFQENNHIGMNDLDRENEPGKTYKLIFVGSLSQRYKGLHILLEALRTCLSNNFHITLDVLGDGKHREEYELMALKLGLDKNVNFYGYVKQGEDVFKMLHRSNLFVMPSLMEGLPRALIEAMACGLPCIGTRIGGIPELLQAEDIVPPGDPQKLADKIMEILADPMRMDSTGSRNLEVAKDFRPEVLRSKRLHFFNYIRDMTLDHRNRWQPEKAKGFG